ncbi:hypothetical protein P4133_17430 [Pseudomonas aeruginosa]|nr:hypothetical protein [Pseudomonas aeruginosa]
MKYFQCRGLAGVHRVAAGWASECPWADGEENHIHLDLEDIPGVEGSLELIREKLGDGRLHALVDNAGISPRAKTARASVCWKPTTPPGCGCSTSTCSPPRCWRAACSPS